MNDSNLKLISQDYDKNPIEIKDYNTLFEFLITISMIPIAIYAYIHNLNAPGGMSESSLNRHIFIIIPFLLVKISLGIIRNRKKPNHYNFDI